MLKASPSIVSAGIYTLDGTAFATYLERGADQIPKLPVVCQAGRSDILVVHANRARVVVEPICLEGKTTGTVYIESDLQALYVRLMRYVGIASLVLVVSLLAALMVSSIFGRSVAEPIARLAETARIVSRDKKYSVRAQPARKMESLPILIEAFNEMLAADRTSRRGPAKSAEMSWNASGRTDGATGSSQQRTGGVQLFRLA